MTLPGRAAPPHTPRSIHRVVMLAKVGFLTPDVLIGLGLGQLKRESPGLALPGLWWLVPLSSCVIRAQVTAHDLTTKPDTASWNLACLTWLLMSSA